ncbi:MAG: hypothetical protein CMH57_03560 [Myxococcales bacterium]|nr:hypothetical protein [Myxococcales bacterium]
MGWGSASRAQSGWLMPHGDAAAQGRASGQGQIEEPNITLKATIGGRLADTGLKVTRVAADGSLDAVMAVGGAVLYSTSRQGALWDTPPLGTSSIAGVWDFDGDGRDEVLVGGRHPSLLDRFTGQVVWRAPEALEVSGATYAAVPYDDDPEPELLLTSARNPATAILFDFSGGFGAVREVWRNSDDRLPSGSFSLILGDFDGDGLKRELVAVISDCRLLFLSLDDGQVYAESAPLSGGGSYCAGLVQAEDLDGVLGDELIVTGAQGNQNGAVGLYVYKPTTEALLWSYEYGVGDSLKRSAALTHAVADMNGDGSLEVALSVFDNTEEAGAAQDGVVAPSRWSVSVYDAVNGALVDSVEDVTLLGWLNSDADGQPELVVRSAVEGSVQIPRFGTIQGLGIGAERRLVTRWSLSGAEAVMETLTDLSRARDSRGMNTEPVWLAGPGWGGGGALVLRGGDEGSEMRMQLVGFEEGAPQVRAERVMEPTSVSALTPLHNEREAPGVLVKDNLGRVQLLNEALEVQETLTFSGHSSGLRVAPDPSSATLVIVDSSSNLTAFEPFSSGPGEPPAAKWRAAASSISSYVALDVDGDGLHEHAYAGLGIDGVPFVRLLDSDGETLWRVRFTDSRSEPESLVVGQFGGDASLDLAVLNNSQDQQRRIITLDGSAGATLASQAVDEDEAGRFPGVEALALPDMNDDGFTELLHIHRFTFEIRDGATLERRGDLHAFPDGVSLPTANSVFQADEDGALEGFFNFFFRGKAVMDLESGEVQWRVESPDHLHRFESGYAGLADATGDGVWDVALAGSLGDLTVWDGASGEVVYRRCLVDGALTPLVQVATVESCAESVSLSPIVVADIDSDGEEEYIVGTSQGWLYSVQVRDGALDWSLPLQFETRQPVVADVDNDGFLEIALTTSGSELVVVDQASLDAPSALREVAVSPDNVLLAPESDIDRWDRADVLGLAWEPVEGAAGYRYAVFTENNNLVRPQTDVGDATSIVVDGLALVPGQRYYATVAAYNAAGGPSADTASDGVLVVQGLPLILDFRATPNPFAPAAGERATFSAQISSTNPLTGVALTVRDEGGAEVFQYGEEELASGQFTLDVDWAGLDEGGEPLPPGPYTADLIASTEDAPGIAQLQVVIEAPEEPEEDVGPDVVEDTGVAMEDTGVVAPDTGSLDAGMGDVVESDVQAVAVTGPRGDGCGCEVPGRGAARVGGWWWGVVGLLLLAAQRWRSV